MSKDDTVRSNYGLAAKIWSDFDFKMADFSGECPEFGRTRAVQNCVTYSHSLNLWNLFSSAAVIGYEDRGGNRVSSRKTIINEVNFKSSGLVSKEAVGSEKPALIDRSLLNQKSKETNSPSLVGFLSGPISEWHNPLPLLNCLLAANALVDNATWSLTAIAPLHDFIDVNYARFDENAPLVRAELIDKTFDTKFIAMTLEEYCWFARKDHLIDKRNPKADLHQPRLRSPSNFKFESYRNHVAIPVLNEMLSDPSVIPYIMLHVCNIVQDTIRLRTKLQNATNRNNLNCEVEMIPFACLTRTPKTRRAILVTVKDVATGLYSENGNRIRCLVRNADEYVLDWKTVSDSNWIYEFDLNHETQAYLRSHFSDGGRSCTMQDKDRIFQYLKAFTAGPGRPTCFKFSVIHSLTHSNPNQACSRKRWPCRRNAASAPQYPNRSWIRIQAKRPKNWRLSVWLC